MISKNKTFLLLFCLFFLFANFSFAFATNGIPEDDSGKIEFIPQIGIPGSEFKAGTKVPISGSSFIDYMSAIYTWSVRAIAIIAIIMIMIAGFQWMTAAGNASAIGQAKSRISSSLIGLLLAIGAYSLLNFVNPSLVNLRTLDMGNIDYVALETYEVKCDKDEKKVYTWPYHRCFTIGHDDWSSESFFLSDLFIGVEDAKKVFAFEDIETVEVTIGVDKLQTDNCDAKNNFDKMAPKGRKTMYIVPPLFTNLIAYDQSVKEAYDFEKNDLYNNLGADSAAIIFIAIPSDDSQYLKGFYVETGNKSPGEASAFFADISINTNVYCSSCCRGVDDAGNVKINFADTLDCSTLRSDKYKWSNTNPSDCCDTFSNTVCFGLDKHICRGLEQFCGKCIWSDMWAGGACGIVPDI